MNNHLLTFLSFYRQKALWCFIAVIACLSAFWSSPLRADAFFTQALDWQRATLSVDQVFRIHADVKDRQTIMVNFTIVDGHYLYQDKFDFSLADTRIISTNLPPPLDFEDVFSGNVQIYRHQVTIQLNTAHIPKNINLTTLTVSFQGCSDAGICYPVTTRQLSIDLYNVTTKAFDFQRPATTTNWLTNLADDVPILNIGHQSLSALLV